MPTFAQIIETSEEFGRYIGRKHGARAASVMEEYAVQTEHFFRAIVVEDLKMTWVDEDRPISEIERDFTLDVAHEVDRRRMSTESAEFNTRIFQLWKHWWTRRVEHMEEEGGSGL